MQGKSGRRSLALAVALMTGASGAGFAPVAAAATNINASNVGARSGATRIPVGLGGSLSGSIDVGTGNVMIGSADARVPGARGAMQSLGLSFNSLAAGNGWSSPLLAGLVHNDDGSILLTDTDGRQGKFTPTSGSSTTFTAPAGFKKSLVKNADGTFTLTDLPSGAKETFSSTDSGNKGALTATADRFQTDASLTYKTVTGAAWAPGGSVLDAVKFAGGNSVAVAHDEQGRITGLTPTNGAGPAAGKVTYTYTDSTPNNLPPGHQSSTGRVASITVTNVGGHDATTKFTYTGAGDIDTITDPTGAVTKIAYDSNHRVTSLNVAGATTRLSYASGSTMVADANTDQSKAVANVPHTTYALTDGLLASSATDALGRKQSATYTPQGDVASGTNAVGGTTKNTWTSNNGNSLNSSASPTGAKNSWTYGSGVNAYNLATSTDAQGNTSSSTYSTNGSYTGSKNALGVSASVEYNSDGTVKTSTDPTGAQTSYTESGNGQYITKVAPPSGSAMGSITVKDTPATSVTNGDGETTNYTYDGVYNVTKQSSADGEVTYAYDADGRVTKRTDPNQSTAYSYDERGNLASIVTTASTGEAHSSNVSYTYDLNGNMTSRTVDGSKTTYTYDAANQLVSMTNAHGATTRFAYDADGRRTDTWWHTNDDHSQWVAHTHTDFDTSGRTVRSWTARGKDSTRVVDSSYSYTLGGSDTGLVQSITNHTASDAVTTLTYDKGNRLTGAKNWNGKNYSYTYDDNGNRLSATVDSSKQSLTYTADNQISSSGYSYDKAGRRTNDPTTGSMKWNSLGQMVEQKKTGTSTFTYAGAGQDELVRQNSKDGLDDYVYGRSNQAGIPALEKMSINGSNSTFDNDAYGQPIASFDGTRDNFIVYSGLGMWTSSIDENGVQNPIINYDPYGLFLGGSDAPGAQVKANSAAGKNSVKKMTAAAAGGGGETPWTTIGIPSPAATNMWKRGARWNDTSTGTWTSVDPITVLGDPSRANPYVYAASDPINLTDVAGLNPCGAGEQLAASAVLFAGSIAFSELAVPLELAGAASAIWRGTSYAWGGAGLSIGGVCYAMHGSSKSARRMQATLGPR